MIHSYDNLAHLPFYIFRFLLLRPLWSGSWRDGRCLKLTVNSWLPASTSPRNTSERALLAKLRYRGVHKKGFVLSCFIIMILRNFFVFLFVLFLLYYLFVVYSFSPCRTNSECGLWGDKCSILFSLSCFIIYYFGVFLICSKYPAAFLTPWNQY